NAVVEIWQVDNNGSYLHSKGANPDAKGAKDANFQGFGRFLTGSTGEYLFRTIRPVKYPGRAPHIHFAVMVRGMDRFSTQCYVQGDPANSADMVLKGIVSPRARESVVVPFTPLRDSKIGELAARFDIVHGFVPTA